MVDFITGINGIGKTRIMAEAATETAKISNGNVVFIDSGTKLFGVLPPQIRLINIDDYNIESAMSFYGFLIGLCAGDYDLTDVFIDSTLDIISSENTNIDDFFNFLNEMSKSTGVDFHFSVCDSTARQLVYQNAG
ncbi:MAG: hypothetical protein LIO62_00380 [Clostridiales bacterium]|nr:hypothetical protein [Clostridiales bacterium]